MIPMGFRERWKVPTRRLWGSGARLSGSHSQRKVEALFLFLQDGGDEHTPHGTSGDCRTPGRDEHLVNVSILNIQKTRPLWTWHKPPTALHSPVSKSARP